MALYKRANSKYWWTKFTFDGETVQQSTKCTKKSDAQIFESAYRTALALGKVGIEPKKEIPTFEKAVADFLVWQKIEHAGQPATYDRNYRSCNPLKEFFGKTRIDRIEKKDIEKFIAWRSNQKSKKTGEKITRGTVNKELIVLKMIFSRLVDARLLRENPARKIKRLPENELAFHVITKEEERRYLLACAPTLRDVATLMLETGMRCGEVYQLRRGDVQLEKFYLNVTKGKTKAARRRVHISPRACDVLARRMKNFKGDCLFPKDDRDGDEPTAGVHHEHRETTQRLELNFRLYDCRHTFATRALESGTDPVTLAAILGHANLQMLTRYAHPSEERKAEAVRRMEKSP